MSRLWACPACGQGALGPGQCAPCRGRRRYVEVRPVSDLAPIALGAIPDADVARTPFPGWPGVNRAMHGGLAEGSVTLLYGAPGVGKTRLCLGLAAAVPRALYVTSEQSLTQVKYAARLMGVGDTPLRVLATATVEAVRLDGDAFVVADSLHGFGDAEAAVAHLVALARRSGVPVLTTAHVNAEGDYFGTTTIEHAVDAVVELARSDRRLAWRVVRKYRYGPIGTVAEICDTPGGGLTDALGRLSASPAALEDGGGGTAAGGAAPAAAG